MESQNLSREAQANTRSGSITPINVQMANSIIDVGNNRGHLNNNPIDSVSLVVRVEVFNDRESAPIELLFRDDSGVIKGRIFKSQSSAIIRAIQEFTWTQGCYAYVIGKLNIQENNKYITVHTMKNVHSYREIDMHRAQIIWALLIRNHVLKTVEVKQHKFNMDIDKVSEDYAGLNDTQKNIMKAVKEYSKGNSGINKNNIYKLIKLVPSKIDTELKNLVNYGYLTSDIDEEVFFVVS